MSGSPYWSNAFGRGGPKTGTTRIRSSELSVMMRKREPHVYALAGVCKLKDYIELARSKVINIVTSPGLNKHGDGWIEMNPLLYTSDQVENVQIQATPNRSPNTATSNLPSSLLEGPEWWQDAGPKILARTSLRVLPHAGMLLSSPLPFPHLGRHYHTRDGLARCCQLPLPHMKAMTSFMRPRWRRTSALEDPRTLSQSSSESASARSSSPSRNVKPNGSEPEIDGRFSVLIECFRAKKFEDGQYEFNLQSWPR